MRINWYLLNAGKLAKQPESAGLPASIPAGSGESWFDVESAGPQELRQFLALFELHPLMLDRSTDEKKSAGVISAGRAVLLEFPAALQLETEPQVFLTLILQSPVLITIRHGLFPVIDTLVNQLLDKNAPVLNHVVQIAYLVLDELTDLSVEAETELRDQTLLKGKALEDSPGKVSVADISGLRRRVDNLASLVEDQLYCISGLNASDNTALNEPHRKAYIQDLQSEVEIAQRGISRLEIRVNDLFSLLQIMASDHVEKRLRTLTIFASITLPLGLIAGILGMNVGGVPGITVPYGFIVVMVLMIVIALAELWYFKKKGWFD